MEIYEGGVFGILMEVLGFFGDFLRIFLGGVISVELFGCVFETKSLPKF